MRGVTTQLTQHPLQPRLTLSFNTFRLVTAGCTRCIVSYTIGSMLEIRRTERFDKWLKGLADKQGKSLISDRIERLAQGHFGDAKPIGEGLTELRVHFAPAIGFTSPNAVQRLSCCCAGVIRVLRSGTLSAPDQWRGNWRNERDGNKEKSAGPEEIRCR